MIIFSFIHKSFTPGYSGLTLLCLKDGILDDEHIPNNAINIKSTACNIFIFKWSGLNCWFDSLDDLKVTDAFWWNKVCIYTKITDASHSNTISTENINSFQEVTSIKFCQEYSINKNKFIFHKLNKNVFEGGSDPLMLWNSNF